MAPFRLRSRIAGLLHWAAQMLDRSPSPQPPAVVPAARRPGEPPEHWLRLVRDRAPGLLTGDGIGTGLAAPAGDASGGGGRLRPGDASRPGGASRASLLGRAADPASLRWPADAAPVHPSPSFPSGSSSPPPRSPLPAIPSAPSPTFWRRRGERVRVEAGARSTPGLRVEPPAPGRAARPQRLIQVRRPVAVPEFPVERRRRFTAPQFPVEGREGVAPPQFPVDAREQVTAPEFPLDAGGRVTGSDFPADRPGTVAAPNYRSDPARAARAAVPTWPRLPEPHGQREPAWPHPDPDPSRWPTLPDDTPLWTMPGPSVDDRHVQRLDAEQAGR